MDRLCYWVDEGNYVEGEGFRISIVKENEAGHTPTGTWPYEGKPGQSRPYFAGPTYKDAEKFCDLLNDRLGLSRRDAFNIVLSSMAKQKTTKHAKRTKSKRS